MLSLDRGTLHRNVVCDMAIILPATCSSFMLGLDCYDYDPGPAENYNVLSCALDNCEE
jgi:hypothetical protein